MQIFSFVKKMFVLWWKVLSSSITGPLLCVSMNNQECIVRPKIVDVRATSNESIYET